jgi:hypothetical protein
MSFCLTKDQLCGSLMSRVQVLTCQQNIDQTKQVKDDSLDAPSSQRLCDEGGGRGINLCMSFSIGAAEDGTPQVTAGVAVGRRQSGRCRCDGGPQFD